MQVFEDKTGCKNIGKHYLGESENWKKFQNKIIALKNGEYEDKKIRKNFRTFGKISEKKCY